MDQNNNNLLNDDSFDLFESLDTQPLLGGTTGQSMPSLGSGGYEEMPSLTRTVTSSGGASATGAAPNTAEGEAGVDLNLHPSGIVPTLQYVSLKIHY